LSNSLLPLSTLADTIKAHIARGDKSIGKAEEHYIAAGIHLAEAKERVRRETNLTWPAFLNGQCGIQRRRADELIELADGRKTLAEIRESKAESMRRSRAAGSAQRGAQSGITQSSQSTNNLGGETPEYARLLNRVIQRLKRLDMEALVEVEQFIMENYDV
jgi:hypothetical protein